MMVAAWRRIILETPCQVMRPQGRRNGLAPLHLAAHIDAMHTRSHLSFILAKHRCRYAALALVACALWLVSTASVAGYASVLDADPAAGHPKLTDAMSALNRPADAIPLADTPSVLRGGPPAVRSPLPVRGKAKPVSMQPRQALRPLESPPSDLGSMTFSISTQDKHISSALRRLARAHGWHLSWEVDRDFDVKYDATFSGSFLEIVEQIAGALQNVNTPIRVKAYHGNHVLRVLYATY